MLKGFKDFVMREDVITVAVGLVVALAFSNLVKSFTDTVIDPLVAAAQPHGALGLGVQLGDAGNAKTFIDLGSFIGAIIYFVVFMATVYLAIVVPYRQIQKRRGVTVFGEAPATTACGECCSDSPEAAHKCKFCASVQSGAPAGG